MTFEEALRFLSARIDFERFAGPGVRPGNDRIRELMDLLDHPEGTFPSIHVTGTNGKFSVCAMASAILLEHGLTVGTYTSPHLESVRERIALNGEPIAEGRFADVVEYLVPFIELVEARMDERLTFFEVLTAMAVEVFFDAPVHAGVLEVGLGGEYDATNVVDAKVAVITKVARDHIPQFGDDRVRAAWEKSGIAKEGSVVLSGVHQPELAKIVDERARERGASRVARLGRDFDLQYRAPAVGGQVLSVRGLEEEYTDLFLPVFGLQQAENAAFAIAACEAFLEGPVPRDVVASALGRVGLPARLEIMGRHPLVVVDGGHNEDAATAVLRTIADEFAFDRFVCVLAMLDDKPVEDVIALLQPVVDRFVVTVPNFERGAAAARLVEALSAVGVPEELVVARSTVADALDAALSDAGEADLVLVFGSMYTAGEARGYLRERAAARPA